MLPLVRDVEKFFNMKQTIYNVLTSELMRRITKQTVLYPHHILMVTAKEVNREEPVAERADDVQHQTKDHFHLTVSLMVKMDTPIPPMYHLSMPK